MLQDLEKTLEPIFYYYKHRRLNNESLGDFTARVGFEVLKSYAQSFVSEDELKSLPQVCCIQNEFRVVMQAVVMTKMKMSKHYCQCNPTVWRHPKTRSLYVQVGVSKEMFAALESRAASEGKSIAHIAGEAIRGLVA